MSVPASSVKNWLAKQVQDQQSHVVRRGTLAVSAGLTHLAGQWRVLSWQKQLGGPAYRACARFGIPRNCWLAVAM